LLLSSLATCTALGSSHLRPCHHDRSISSDCACQHCWYVSWTTDHAIAANEGNSFFAQSSKFTIKQCAPRAHLPDLMAERKMEAREGRENQRTSSDMVARMPTSSTISRNCSLASSHRLRYERRASRRRCCPSFRRQKESPPHLLHPPHHLGPAKGRLGAG